MEAPSPSPELALHISPLCLLLSDILLQEASKPVKSSVSLSSVSNASKFIKPKEGMDESNNL